MKQKIVIFSIIFILAVSVIAILITVSTETLHKRECDIYFLNESESTIVSEKHVIKYRNDYDLKAEVIETLISGPDLSKNKPVISRKTKILSLQSISASEIMVDFNNKFLSGETAKDVLSVYAVVKTLCALDGVEKVKVTVDKNDISTAEGKVLGFLGDEDINLPTDTNTSETREVTLYFADKNSDTLVPEKRIIKVTDQLPLAQYIINEIIQGTNNNACDNVLSKDTILIGVNIMENICFVNFQSNFVTKNSGSKRKETLAVYSIVNALTELENIGRVQFLIDGKKVKNFGNIGFDSMFERNVSIIKSS